MPALPTGMHSASISPELVEDLERRGLLALQPERVDRVHERDRAPLRELAHELERLVEVAAQRDHARAVHQRLGELARGDLALGDDHDAGQPPARGVGGGARGGVAGRGADERLGALAHGRGDRAGHPAVLERAGRVGALDLQPHLRAGALGQPLGEHVRRRALAERDDRVLGRERQALAIALDQAGHQAGSVAAPSSARGSGTAPAARPAGAPVGRRAASRRARSARAAARGRRRDAGSAASSSRPAPACWKLPRTVLAARAAAPARGPPRRGRNGRRAAAREHGARRRKRTRPASESR